MKSMFAPTSESLRLHRRGIRGATLALSLTIVLWSGIAEAGPRKSAPPVAPEGKAIRDAKTVQAPVPQRRRVLTFNERFTSAPVRTFTTWW